MRVIRADGSSLLRRYAHAILAASPLVFIKLKNRYALRTRVCYLEIQRSRGKEGSARFASKGHLRFVSVALEFHCGCWKARYTSELFIFFIFLSLS